LRSEAQTTYDDGPIAELCIRMAVICRRKEKSPRYYSVQ